VNLLLLLGGILLGILGLAVVPFLILCACHALSLGIKWLARHV